MQSNLIVEIVGWVSLSLILLRYANWVQSVWCFLNLLLMSRREAEQKKYYYFNLSSLPCSLWSFGCVCSPTQGFSRLQDYRGSKLPVFPSQCSQVRFASCVPSETQEKSSRLSLSRFDDETDWCRSRLQSIGHGQSKPRLSTRRSCRSWIGCELRCTLRGWRSTVKSIFCLIRYKSSSVPRSFRLPCRLWSQRTQVCTLRSLVHPVWSLWSLRARSVSFCVWVRVALGVPQGLPWWVESLLMS